MKMEWNGMQKQFDSLKENGWHGYDWSLEKK